MAKKILVVGSGGREHALLWKLQQSADVRLYATPGNAGTSSVATTLPEMSDSQLVDFAATNAIDLTIVGPDEALANGLVDMFQSRGLRIFGPTKAAARLESSKAFAKEFMAEQGIPTARFAIFDEYEKALRHVRKKGAPIVVKASGLARGKGVFVCKTVVEAEAALKIIMIDHRFGDAGRNVVVEEFLDGPELSVHALCDGESYVLLPFVRDYKGRDEGNRGPMTGGMGSVTGPLRLPAGSEEQIRKRVIEPTLAAMAKRGTPFVGCLYPGIKLTDEGVKVLEFNVRFGDPETQSLVRVLGGDFLELLERCVDGTLGKAKRIAADQFAACVVIASDRYPESGTTDRRIEGIDIATLVGGAVVFHAGTVVARGMLCARGGRILGVTAMSRSLQAAVYLATNSAALIRFEGMRYRKDIGADLLGAGS